MIIDVVMPKMGESITEGTILEWKKQVGDSNHPLVFSILKSSPL